jgi:putative glutamine amidotransferase
MTTTPFRPIIGISAYPRTGNPPGFAVPCGYVDAVRRAGGIPVALPPGDPEPAHYLDLVDGLILAGGGDIDPDAYGGAKHHTVYAVCAERDAFELRLVRAALARDTTPMLCICRGMQVLNVALGGDLHVDIPDAVGKAVAHRHPERRPVRHEATVDALSRLGTILGAKKLVVESWHHQAVREIGRDLKAVAWAEDGLVEAVEHVSHRWCVAVQWHPELQPDCPIQQRLFSALVAATADDRVAAQSA